ncbi:beta-glucosidase 11-like isoform X2 [Juglans regia]|uniref:Beta-glucosidase 11-like isoform X2 n=1 Tax=Juglans regia TaxID=51240 RepID=A0A6P9EWP8_JUGRE|nr:beta-glucosidase 11-like isoform X2 [Juglans regia]
MLRLVVVLLTNLAVLVLSAHKFSRDDFPPGFVFGASTSAYQVEGAANQDGRTPSIWDTFAQAGNMHGATGDTACDGYHKYKEDVQLMGDTGLEAYRFSISWSRLLPNGRGTVNPKGLQYYNNLINELISHGIQPHVTLHHNDLPQTLEDEYGGWISRKSVEFGDRVPYWTTFNEANVFVMGGYDTGNLPPQRCSSPSPYGINCSRGSSSTEPYLAAHHILLAHASAARLYKNMYQEKQLGFIGINVFGYWFVPLTNSSDDKIAAQRANDFFFGWMVDPLVFGEYPDAMKKNVGSRMPVFTTAESNWIKGSFDFLGVNHYLTTYVKDSPSSLKIKERDFFADMAVELSSFENDTSRFEFPIVAWGLQELLEYIKRVYGNPPVYIHENAKISHLGTWNLTIRSSERMIRNLTMEDWPRVEYLHAYIGSLLDALRNGSNTKGYFIWSLMDLLELLEGFESGYGLYYVDLDDPDLKRQPKLSAHWYSHFLKRSKGMRLQGLTELGMNLSALSQYSHFFQ